MKTLLACILLATMIGPLQADMRKDIKEHDKRMDEYEDALGGLAQQMFFFQYQIEQLEQRMHDLELKMEYRNGKNCVDTSF